MAEFIANALQTVDANGVVVFYNTSYRCDCNNCCSCSCVEHADGTGSIILRGCKPCRCKVKYRISFTGNIAVPTDGTVGAISVALAVNGEPIPATTATVTPAAVEEFFNISIDRNIEVPANCCLTVAVRNINTQAIQVQNANLIVERTKEA